SSLRYIALPNWFHEAHLESSTSNAQDTCNADAPESSGNSNPTATSTNPPNDHMETLAVETPIPTVSSPVLTTCLDDSPQLLSDSRLISKRVTSQDDTPSLDNILTLTNRFEDILRVTTNTDDSNGVEADLGNMENNISASPTPTFRIHKDHPKSQIIGHVDTLVQTRTKSIEMEEQSFIATIHQKTNPSLLQFFLFSCFISQEEPKKRFDALKDPSWVLKNKQDERGIVIRNKARLVAQGHTQEEGIDYDKVFALVARIEAIRLFLAYVSFIGFTVYQMDVKSAFFYGTIDEEVYVMQPLGFQDPEFSARVYKVEKAMYGLHQAPRAWYGTLSKYLLTNGFQRGTIDQTLFIRKQRGDFILVQVYVDDIIFGSSNPQLCREFEALMQEKFQMSAMGELNFFLGLQVLQKKDGIFLSQDKYVGDILKKFGYSDVKSANTPMDKENPWGKYGTRKDVEHAMRGLVSWKYIIYTAIYQFLGRTVPLFESMLVTMGEGSGTPTEPHHTPSPEAQQTSPTTHSSPLLSPVTTKPLPTVIPSDTPQLRQYTRRAQIAQSLALPPVANKHVSPIGDDSQGEACPADSGLEAEQVRANITKTSTLPSDSTPRATSLAADEGSMQQQLNELTDLPGLSCWRTENEEVLNNLETMPQSRGSLDEGEEAAIEKSTEKGSNDTEEIVNVLTSLDAATILSSRVSVSISPVTKVFVAEVPTGSGSIPTASPPGTGVPTGGVPTGSDVMARQLEEEMERDAQRMDEQITRDAEIARIHAEEELQIMIDGLDMNNETVAKYLQEYYQFARDLPIGERIELISNLVKYQDSYAKVLKYQIQQRKPLSRKQQKEFYVSVLKSHAGWKAKHFKGMTLEEIKEKFDPLVPVEEVYVEALQVKHPIIDWEVHTEGQRTYWKIIRLGGSSARYQFFVDLLKHFDREDLNQLWALVKETLNIRPATSDKEKELWVELKRLYEPDVEDLLWTHTLNMMHAPVEWKLYDTCEVHHKRDTTAEKIALLMKTGVSHGQRHIYNIQRRVTVTQLS
nr:hypothetical protein [Tanacetum cinerariifolium]